MELNKLVQLSSLTALYDAHKGSNFANILLIMITVDFVVNHYKYHIVTSQDQHILLLQLIFIEL